MGLKMVKLESEDMSSVEIDILRLLCVAVCERAIGFEGWIKKVDPSMKSNDSRIILNYISRFGGDSLKNDLRQVWATLGDYDKRMELIKKIKSGNKTI